MEFFDYHRVSRPADFNQATTVSTWIFKVPGMRVLTDLFVCAAHIVQHTLLLWYAHSLTLMLRTMPPDELF